MRPKEIAEATGKIDNTTRQLLMKMRETGEVVEVSGLYYHPDHAPLPANMPGKSCRR